MNTKNHMKAVKTLFNESVCDVLFTSSIVHNDPSTPSFRGNVEKYKQMEETYRTALPYKKAVIDDIWAFDNKGAVASWKINRFFSLFFRVHTLT